MGPSPGADRGFRRRDGGWGDSTCRRCRSWRPPGSKPAAGTGRGIGRAPRAPGRADPLLVTYLGGRGGESGNALAVAPDGDAVVLGPSGSADSVVLSSRAALPASGARSARS